MNKAVVIVGAGQAGLQTASSLRDNGFDGRIALIGDEAELPYERPPLSKSYLTGAKSRDDLQLRPEKFYAARNIELVLGEQTNEIDRAARRILLRSGKHVSYDHLVLATGARNRRLPAGLGMEGILDLRTVTDADILCEYLAAAHDVVIIGGGFIGLELAAVLTKLGKQAFVLDQMPRVMSRAVSSDVSQFFAHAHESWGNEIVTGVTVTNFIAKRGKVSAVQTDDGRTYAADLVLVGIGVIPNAEVAMAAGLPCRNGIIVDRQLCTADPAISAIGDCALFPNVSNGHPIRLESVQNAADHARCVASRLVGSVVNYGSVPWFWSDQNDLRLQIAGLTSDCDCTVMRGDPGTRKFSVFCFRRNEFIGVESVNAAADHMFGRQLLVAGGTLTPHQARDTSLDLKAHLRACQHEKLGVVAIQT